MPWVISSIISRLLRCSCQFLPASSCRLKHRVVARVVGVVAGRAVARRAVRVPGQIVGDRDRLAVGDQEAVIGAFERRPAAHPRAGAGPQQVDRAPPPKSCRRPSAGKCRSWVPQPSSAGCEPSLTKPSIDQVLTNSPGCFGIAETWVSRSAMWMTLTPSRSASAAQRGAVGRDFRRGIGVAGDVEQAPA